MAGERADAPAPINLQSIADYSGIARQTVRRKLHDLERVGWITGHDKGFLVATAMPRRQVPGAPRKG